MTTVSTSPHTDDVGPWLLVQTKPNAWRIAERNLLRQGLITFNPVEKRSFPRRGRFVTERCPLFPGYLFVHADPTRAAIRAINSTYGVSRLVSFTAEGPQIVPSTLVASIMARCDSEGCIIPACDVEAGTKVRITTGYFADFVTTVTAIAPNKRVWVMFDIMGRETRVLMDPATVTRT